MKPQTKLALKRWAVRQIRKLLWRADEWIHSQEVKLRLEAEQAVAGTVTRTPSKGRAQSVSVQQPGKTFEQWQAGRSASQSPVERSAPLHESCERVPARSGADRAGIRPHRQKKRLTAAQFDSTFGLRFSR
jgi:hypothetical protein